MLHAVDDEHVHWPFGSLNFETKLLLQRRNERRTVGIDRRNAGRRRPRWHLLGCPSEAEIVRSVRPVLSMTNRCKWLDRLAASCSIVTAEAIVRAGPPIKRQGGASIGEFAAGGALAPANSASQSSLDL